MTADSDGSVSKLLAPEALVRVTVNDAATLVWSCTPVDLSMLAAGWLVSEGVVRTPGEIESMDVAGSQDRFAARVSVRVARPALDRLLRGLSRDSEPVPVIGPAALGTPDDSLSFLGPSDPGLRPLLEDRGRVASWFRDMFDGASLRSSVGGMHTGGLVVDGGLASVVEDVSRHHVVDRLVGAAVLARAPLRSSILLVSARISGAMASKACRAGVGALVSRSVPTELAVAVAARAGLILVGRARRERPQYFWPQLGTPG